MQQQRSRLTGASRAIIAVCTIVLSAVASTPAQANVRSRALYARGLIPFNSEQWQQAYTLFDQAVQADPTDAVALYYRGLTAVRLKQTSEAIKDLEQALALDPSLPHAALDLGIAYFDAGQYAAAKPWLERAYQQGSERLVCEFFLGVTSYRLGEDAAALAYLNEAKADPEVRAAAQYYAGLALARQGDTAAARAAFAQVAQEQPQSEIGRAALRYGGLEEARLPPPTMGGGAQKPWSVYGKLGFEYDSNVLIAPSNSALKTAQGISDESDGRAVIGAGGGYTLLDADIGSARVSYDFSQSIHFQLTDFDLQGHRLRLDLASKPGTVRYGISGTYDFYALDYQTFFQEGLGTPWVALTERDECGHAIVLHGPRPRLLPLPVRSVARCGRPGRGPATSTSASGRLRMRVLSLGYQFDSEDTARPRSGRSADHLLADDADQWLWGARLRVQWQPIRRRPRGAAVRRGARASSPTNSASRTISFRTAVSILPSAATITSIRLPWAWSTI